MSSLHEMRLTFFTNNHTSFAQYTTNYIRLIIMALQCQKKYSSWISFRFFQVPEKMIWMIFFSYLIGILINWSTLLDYNTKVSDSISKFRRSFEKKIRFEFSEKLFYHSHSSETSGNLRELQYDGFFIERVSTDFLKL